MSPDRVAALLLFAVFIVGLIAWAWDQAPLAKTTALADFDQAAEQACALTVDYPTEPIPTLDELAARRDRGARR